jgi:chromosome segregation ATPase
MKYFLTYDEAEVFPGPRLNVVLGPNGTGKSALTHAICLACGGSPGTVGRSPDLSQFVKRGHEDDIAWAEVALFEEVKGCVVTIRRQINGKNQTSKWTMQGKASTLQEVRRYMASMKINVDNLCSFMAQDKVGHFTQQDAKGILSMTLESIMSKDDPTKTMKQVQSELASVESSKMEQGANLDRKREKVTKLQGELASMTAEKERMEKQQECKRVYKLYEMKKVVVEQLNARNKKKEAQAALDEAEKLLVNQNLALEPYEACRLSLENDLKKRQSIAARYSAKLKAECNLCKANKEDLEELDEEIVGANKSFGALTNELNKCQADLERKNNECTKLQQEIKLADEKKSRGLSEMENVNEESSRLQKEIEGINDQVYKLSNDWKICQQDIKSANKALAGLTDHSMIFKNMLEALNTFTSKNVLPMMEWIEKNSDKFKGEVFGPIASHMGVTDAGIGFMVMNHVSFNSLMTFVVTHEHDEKLLLDTKNLKKWKVDIAIVKTNEEYNGPWNSQDLGSYTELGLKGYLIDEITMPPTVKSFLCKWNNLHLVLWARTKAAASLVSDNHIAALSRKTKGFLNLYAQDISQKEPITVKFSSSVSKYAALDANPTILRNDLKYSKTPFVQGGDESEGTRERLNESIAESKENGARTQDAITELKRNSAKLTDKLGEFRARRAALKKVISAPEDTRRKLTQVERQRIAVQEKLQKLGSGENRKEMEGKIMKAMSAQFTELSAFFENCSKVCGAFVQRTSADVCSAKLSDAINTAKENIALKRGEVNNAQRNRDIVLRERDEVMGSCKIAEAAFKRYEDRYGQEKFIQIYGDCVKNCPEKTLSEIQDKMDLLEAELNEVVDNPQVS